MSLIDDLQWSTIKGNYRSFVVRVEPLFALRGLLCWQSSSIAYGGHQWRL